MLKPLDPCGRVVDFLRSCYRTKVRLGDGDDSIVEIEWYFVPPGRPDLGLWTPFCSRNWDKFYSEYPELPLGEVAGEPRPWRDGSAPAPCYSGLGRCGTREQWERGIGAERPYSEPRPPGHCPGCCDPGYGIKLGGGSELKTPSGILLGGAALVPAGGGVLLGGGVEVPTAPALGGGVELAGSAGVELPGGFHVGGGVELPSSAGLSFGAGRSAGPVGPGRAGALLGGGSSDLGGRRGGGELLGGGSALVVPCTVNYAAQGNNKAAATSVAVSFTQATVAGSCLWAGVAARDAGGTAPVITGPAGWTFGTTTPRAPVRVAQFYRPNAPSVVGPLTFSFAGSAGAICVQLIEFFPVGGASPIDALGGGVGSNAAPTVSTGSGLSQLCEWVIATFAFEGRTGTPTVTSAGWSFHSRVFDTVGWTDLHVVDRRAGSTGVQTASESIPAAVPWCACVMSIKSP